MRQVVIGWGLTVLCMSLATVLMLTLLFTAHLLLLGAIVTICMRGSFRTALVGEEGGKAGV